jgi:hypothetical protein
VSRITNPEEAEKYLELFRTHGDKYLIGLYQPGITIYKQQVRALNIFYCLHLTGRINKDSIIAVIGGGIAGVTFAAASSKSKIETHIFEKYEEYIPIQQRCKGRELHPHIYDWPLTGSTHENADLPILNWSRGSVQTFCETVLNELKEIKASFREDGSAHVQYLFEYFNCRNIESINFNTSKKKYTIKANIPKTKVTSKASKSVTVSPDVIIYAVGYGIEKSSYGGKTASYWRDIDTHQVNLHDRKYFISGTGDGALMDLFVILIKNFSYGHLVKTITDNAHGKYLIGELQKLKKEFFDIKDRPANYVFKQLDTLFHACKGVDDALEFNNTKVVMNGEVSFEKCLNLDKVSLLNAFFAFLLYKKRKFTFTTGEMTYDEKTGACSVKDDKNKYDDYVHFFRHGTDKNAFLKSIPHLFNEVTDQHLQKKQKESLPSGMIEKKWENNDLHQIFRRAHYDEIERVSANTLPILECYTNILFHAFTYLLKKTAKFRIALHKVEIKADGPYFVQVTPYIGTQNYTFKAGYARLFNATGNVGYSIHTGKPSLITMNERDDAVVFEKYLTELGLANAGRKLTKRKAFFTMPILAPVPGHSQPGTGQYLPNLILYIDADQHSFFSDSNIFETIISATCGFIKAFESTLEKQQFKMDESDYTSDMITDEGFSSLTFSPFFRNKDKHFKSFFTKWELLVAQNVITFKKFHSFTSTVQIDQIK